MNEILEGKELFDKVMAFRLANIQDMREAKTKKERDVLREERKTILRMLSKLDYEEE